MNVSYHKWLLRRMKCLWTNKTMLLIVVASCKIAPTYLNEQSNWPRNCWIGGLYIVLVVTPLNRDRSFYLSIYLLVVWFIAGPTTFLHVGHILANSSKSHSSQIYVIIIVVPPQCPTQIAISSSSHLRLGSSQAFYNPDAISYQMLMALPLWLLVSMGGKHSQCPGPSPTLGSLGASHLWRHKS